MVARLRDYANIHEIILLKDVSARLLTEWRNKIKSGSPAVHWSVVKKLWLRPLRAGLIKDLYPFILLQRWSDRGDAQGLPHRRRMHSDWDVSNDAT
jgi:hypothetical protein